MNSLPLLAAALLALVSTAGLRGGTESPLLIIQGGQLFDSNAGRLETVGAVVIAGDRIREVLPPGKALPVPPGATVIDAAGKFLLPGFIDGHPLADIRNTRRISRVIRGGIVCDPAALLKLVPAE